MCIHVQRIFSLVYMISLFRAAAAGLTALTCATILSIWQFELQDLFFGLQYNAHKWTFGRIIEHNTHFINFSGTKLCFYHPTLGIKAMSTHTNKSE